MRKEKVLLTGASGFIGRALSQSLLRVGYEVHALVRPGSSAALPTELIAHPCDLREDREIGRLMDKIKPEFFLHLAARAIPNRQLGDFELQLQETVLPTLALARCLPPDLKLAIFFGSCEEYGNGATPFLEDQAAHCFSPYGWAKISAYHGAEFICAERRVPFCWVRPFLTFGPGQKSQQIIPFLIRGCLADNEIALSPGEQTRDFIYIDDLCLMIERLLKDPTRASAGRVFNLCTMTPRTIRQVAEEIQFLCQQRGRLRFGALPYRSHEAMSFFGSNQKYLEAFGPVPWTPFAKALQQTIDADVTE